MEGYDGMAWEWFENPGVVIRTVGEPAEAIRHYAGVESPLVDYKQKGSIARIIGETMLDDRPVTVIQLTRRDEFVEQFYIDRETYLIVASGYEAPIHAFGNDVVRLSRFSDHRTVAGTKIPHRSESIELPSGASLDAMQWGSIKANQDLPDDWFSPPDFERTPMRSFIEQLYLQRVDTNAMMWIYHEFRLANPKVNTSDAANIAGFQSLKTGATDAAIVLLEQNARDNPGAVDARFGLGRAYRTAKRLDDARREFAAALAIDPDNARAKAALTEPE
jgi:tetratricopeptide (TPR) repeat protein